MVDASSSSDTLRPQAFQAVLEQLRRQKVPMLFAEQLPAGKALQRVSSLSGVPIAAAPLMADGLAAEPDGNSNLVRNTAQDGDFVCKTGENWKDTYSKHFPHDRPFFDEANKVKMCARWFIKGDCYDNCSRKASHVSKDDLPADRKASFLGFMKKCRDAGKKGN